MNWFCDGRYTNATDLDFSLSRFVFFSLFWLWPVTYYRNPTRNQWVRAYLLHKITAGWSLCSSMNMGLVMQSWYMLLHFYVTSFSLSFLSHLTGPHWERGEDHQQHREKVIQVCSSLDKAASTHKKVPYKYRFKITALPLGVERNTISVSIWWA